MDSPNYNVIDLLWSFDGIEAIDCTQTYNSVDVLLLHHKQCGFTTICNQRLI